MSGTRARPGAIGLARVTGASMLPTLVAGDRLLVRHGARPRHGSVVVVRLPPDQAGRPRPLAVKRLAGIRHDGALWVLSDGHGTDSRELGHLDPQALVAVALLRLPRWAPRRWPRLLRPEPSRLSGRDRGRGAA